MNKIIKNSHGFSPVHALGLLLLIGIVGFTGWYIWSTNKSKSSNNATQQAVANQSATSVGNEKPVELTKAYSDTVGKFSVNYPSNWKLTEVKDDTDDDYATSKALMTSPTGTVLTLRSDPGGRGGDCQPRSGDKPFAAGNLCATKEILSSEKLPINNIYYADDIKDANGTYTSVFKESSVVLVTGRYASIDGKSEYGIGILNSNPKFPVEVNKPTMGYVVPDYFITPFNKAGKFNNYIYIYTDNDNESFLKSADAETVKAIIRTLKVTV